MDAAGFVRTIRRAGRPEERLAWCAAILAAEARTPVEVVGGSAIELYLSSDAYGSQHVDLVGDRHRISEVLRRWGFREMEGRSGRVYWFKENIGLVDLVGTVARSGLPPRRMETRFGPVLLSALEPLIARRLMRSHREDSAALFHQAVMLARLGPLDWEFLESEARYEKFTPLLRRFKRTIARPRSMKERGSEARSGRFPA